MSERTVIRRRGTTGQPPVQSPVIPQAVFVAPPFATPEPEIGPPVPLTRSGFCRPDAPEWSHRKCPGRLGTRAKPADCRCECHRGRS